MSSDTCHHARNLMWGCAECELEGKLSQVRSELSELRHEVQRLLDLKATLNTRLAALTQERDELKERIAELEKKHETDADQFASGRRYEQSWGEVRESTLEDRVVELENQLEFERDLRVQVQQKYDQLVEDTKEEQGVEDG